MTLLESIYKEPQFWSVNEYWFIHKSGARIWIANGLFFCAPPFGSYGLLQRIQTWRAFRWWVKHAPVDKLAEIAD